PRRRLFRTWRQVLGRWRPNESRRPRASGDPYSSDRCLWVPASAGTTPSKRHAGRYQSRVKTGGRRGSLQCNQHHIPREPLQVKRPHQRHIARRGRHALVFYAKLMQGYPEMSLLPRFALSRQRANEAALEQKVTALQTALAQCKGVVKHWRDTRYEVI